jgi:RimJ/RimL family protein N-acetyltransferase
MLTTERLLLRAFTLADAPELKRLINTPEVAMNTLRIPYPYPDGEAERWISTHDQGREKGDHAFAITLRNSNELIGTVGLHVKAEHDLAEIGYWIGVPYWGHGYATEAAAAVVRFGFETLSLNRIFAMHFAGNPASGRVLQKIGMQHEGTLRQHLKKWDEYVDLECYGIVRAEFSQNCGSQSRRM